VAHRELLHDAHFTFCIQSFTFCGLFQENQSALPFGKSLPRFFWGPGRGWRLPSARTNIIPGSCYACREIFLFYGMTLFLDTEFTGLQQSAELISLALVSEEGGWFYAEFTDYDTAALSDWHKEFVLPGLFLEQDRRPGYAAGEGTVARGNRAEVKTALNSWLAQFEKIEIWADVPAYDWVLFCELFGGALHLPKPIFYMPFDFATLLKAQGLDPDRPRESLAEDWAQRHEGAKHNALYDAFLLREGYRRLVAVKGKGG